MKSECKYSFLEAKAKLEALCAYQERCQYELQQKLYSWGIDREDSDRLISDLIQNNFLNEERFVSSFVSGKFRIKKWGRIKIKAELKQRHISSYSIQKGLSEIDPDDYWKSLLHLARKKLKDLYKAKDIWDKKVKLNRFLQSKGYESDLINDAIEEVLKEQQTS